MKYNLLQVLFICTCLINVINTQNDCEETTEFEKTQNSTDHHAQILDQLDQTQIPPNLHEFGESSISYPKMPSDDGEEAITQLLNANAVSYTQLLTDGFCPNIDNNYETNYEANSNAQNPIFKSPKTEENWGQKIMKDDGEDILHKMDSKTAPLSFTRLLTDGVWATNGNEFVLQPNDFADIQSKKVGLEGHENNGHKMEEAFMPAKRKAPLKNEQIIEIMKKYNEIQMENPRLRDSQIAPMLGITQNMLSYYKNRAPTGVEKKERRPYTSEEKGELMKQYMELKQAKLNDREISDKLKVSRNTLSRWKTNFGLNKD